MKRTVTFLNGITSNGRRHYQARFHSWTMFFNGQEAPKSIRPLLLEIVYRTSFWYHRKRQGLFEGF